VVLLSGCAKGRTHIEAEYEHEDNWSEDDTKSPIS
jgi:hypothetical protein